MSNPGSKILPTISTYKPVLKSRISYHASSSDNSDSIRSPAELELEKLNLQKQNIIQLHKHVKNNSQYSKVNQERKSKSKSKSKTNYNKLNQGSQFSDKQSSQINQTESSSENYPIKKVQPLQPNVYIVDKYASKYSSNQLNIALSHSRGLGNETIVAFWLLCIFCSLILDYLQYDFYIFRASTYYIVKSTDMGLITNPIRGEFGWWFLLIILGGLTYGFYVGFNSKSFVVVSVVSGVLVTSEFLIIILAASRDISGKTNVQRTSHPNLIVIALIALCWLFYHSFSLHQLVKNTRKMTNETEYPQDSGTLITQKSANDLDDQPQINVIDLKRKSKTKSKSRRR